MVGDGPILLEPQTTVNGLIVSISLIIIPESSSQVGSDEADTRVREVKTDRAASFVASDSRKASLSIYQLQNMHDQQLEGI